MPSFVDFLVFLGMALLRFGAPLLVVVGIGYLLKRLDRRWEAEAEEYAAKQASQQPEAPRPVERPAVPVRQPSEAPQMPFIIAPPASRDQRQQFAQPGMAAPVADAGRGVKRAGENGKAQCSAVSTADKPCWQARFDAEGQVPDECVNCDVFQRFPLM